MVFFFSCLVGSQSCNRVKLAVVVWIIVAACTAITGDMKLSHLGFGIQLASQLGMTAAAADRGWYAPPPLAAAGNFVYFMCYSVFVTWSVYNI